MILGRRAVLVLGAAGMLAAGCGEEEPVSSRSEEIVSYGDDLAQYAELHRPAGESRGVVVVIHGGFWKAEYAASLGRPLATSLATEGWTAWNLEYRRVGPAGSGGGGVPQTLDDVAVGIDALADVDDLDTSRVITLGHSAGGHLATWAASRGRFERWQPERVPVTGVVSQAGVLDLRAADELGLGGGAVEAFLGHPPGPADDRVDPIRQVPLDVPVRCVHGRRDTTVPLSQSSDYVAKARATGADADLLEVDGDHFVVIDTSSDVWARTLDLLAAL
jgi:acetyl esterase/lipase